MFSRSDKTDETGEDLFAEESKQRSPMVLAIVAGLLAIAGAFLLVRYLSTTDDTPVAAPVDDADKVPVLIVTQPIPAGTKVADILAAPASYLSAEAIEDQYVAQSAISSIDELRNLEDLTLGVEAFAGEQLSRNRLIDPSDFQNESYIERAAAVDPPEGHHTVVLRLSAEAALGGNVRAGDLVSVISSFRGPIEGESLDFSMLILPVVEVVSVETDALVVGEISSDLDAVGTVTAGDFQVTLAVTPDELTDLTYAMEYGQIVLSGPPAGASPDDPRPITSLATVFAKSEGGERSLSDILGIDLDEEPEGFDLGGLSDDSSDADDEAADADSEG